MASFLPKEPKNKKLEMDKKKLHKSALCRLSKRNNDLHSHSAAHQLY